jgi:hypothetical protein
MGAELRIESEDASRLADELAMLTGKSVTDAVLAVLRASVAKERAQQEKLSELLRLAAEVRSHMKHPLPTSDHSFLYDENGLPV